MFSVSISLDGRLDWHLDMDAIRREQAQAAVVSLSDHFDSLGGRSFWQTAARSVSARIHSDSVDLLVMQPGVRLRWMGTEGYPPVVSPEGKLMSIPEDDGNDKPARDYPGLLKFIPIRGKDKLKGILVDAEERMSKRRVKGQYKMVVASTSAGNVRYWLVSHTEHTANPDVINMEHLTNDVESATRTIIKLTNRKRK